MNKFFLFLAFLGGLALSLASVTMLQCPGLTAYGLTVKAMPLLPSTPGSYTLDWSTIDTGGGGISGGEYQMQISIGQPDAGLMSGGSFSLEGGYWPGTIRFWRDYLPSVKR